MNTDLIFKKCTLQDLDVLIDISKNTFVNAFQEYNDPTDFANYLANAFSKETITKELLNLNSTFYFIVLVDVGLVGYVKLNKKEAQHEQFDMNALELQRIYVVKEHQGKKIGEQALSFVINIAKKYKASCLWLGVWEHNTLDDETKLKLRAFKSFFCF